MYVHVGKFYINILKHTKLKEALTYEMLRVILLCMHDLWFIYVPSCDGCV